jgi:excisionase family DNA binding protein
MQTLDLDQAGAWLKCDPETVRAMAASGELPAAKVGRAWVFVDVDLIEWLRSQYRASCHSTKTPPKARTGTPASVLKAVPAYEEALGLPTRQRPSASTMNGARQPGKVLPLQTAKRGNTPQRVG